MNQMKKYSCPLGRMNEIKHEHPERTAYRNGVGMDFDIYFQVWPNRESMARSIRMQERGHNLGKRIWKAVVPLRETEGY